MHQVDYPSAASSVSSYYAPSSASKSARSLRSNSSNDYMYNMDGVLSSGNNRKACATSMQKGTKFLRRILRFRQMDFEFAVWQMINLFIAPHKVYRNFQYRKHTKNQFARDDPAFLVLLSLAFCITSIGFGFVMKLTWLKILKLLLWVVFVDCVAVGILIATLMWFLGNRYLIKHGKNDMDLEWGYAFDVHLNAFFPVLMILHCVQLVLINPLIAQDWFISVLIGNTFWLVALGYYIYITFLGYNVLPFVKKSVALLSPMLLLFVIYIVSLATRWNITKGLLIFYESRV